MGVGALLSRSFQPLLHDLHVREDALGMKGFEICAWVGCAVERRIVEVPQDQAERFLIADLLEPAWR